MVMAAFSDDPQYKLKIYYCNLFEKYYITDGDYVQKIMILMRNAFRFTENQFRLYIMEIDNVFRKKDHLFQNQNILDFYNEFSFSNLYPEIEATPEIAKRLTDLAFELYRSVISLMVSNKLYLPEPVIQQDGILKVNCYHIGGYTKDSIILFKTNPWSPI